MSKEQKRSIKVVQTARDTGDRLQQKGDIEFAQDLGQEMAVIDIVPAKLYQQIEGFGGAFTESTATTVYKMSPKKQEEIINAYFNHSSGLCYTLCRTHINSCDFSLGNYSYDDVDGDTNLEHFDISRDKKALIPLIKEALKVSQGKFRLFASPWSPPSWMKTNGEMNHGGQLKKEYWDTWALFFSKYIKAYEAEGIKMWGITVQNEPEATQTWDSCRYTAEEECDFVKHHLGPRLANDGLGDVKIMVWDHNKDLIYERSKVILSDPEAAKYIWGVAFHWYSGDQFEELAKTHEMFPQTKLLFTEGCQEGGVKLGSWAVGERYGHDIIGDLNNWTVGWVDWNMVLDETGGPNHVGNLCDAPIIADTLTDTVHYQNSYYYLGHFSKFIQVGAYKIGCTTNEENIEVTAFKNPDGSIAVVVMNRSDNEIEFKVREDGLSAVAKSLPHSIMTLVYQEN